MDTKKVVLLAILAMLGLNLWNHWQLDQKASAKATLTQSETKTVVPGSTMQTSDTAQAAEGTSSIVPKTHSQQRVITHAQSRLVKIDTDTLHVGIDPKGATIATASLYQYPVSLKENTPIDILSNNPSNYYVAQSGLTGQQGPDTVKGQVTYRTSASSYKLAEDKNTLTVNFSWSDRGLSVIKQFVFHRGQYDIGVNYQIHNASGQAWTGHLYAQIQRKKQGAGSGSLINPSNYDGASMYTPDKPYLKLKYKQLKEENVSQYIEGGWLAMQQRYFLSAWVPDQRLNQANHYYSSVSANQVYTMGLLGPQINVKAGETKTVQSRFYVGPELADQLKPLAKGLDLTIDYGWLWMISAAIFWVMNHLHQLLGNWGWSIIFTTLLIKILFYKLSEASYSSMAKMRLLQPQLQAIKEKYGNDKKEMSRATMELYQKEKINPLGGCLPMLIQFPFFIALYYVLIEAVQLRQAPFMFWIHDLSTKDPYYILPILMGASMFWQQKMTPTTGDPMQAKMMMSMPIIFTLLFMSFPSGLVLYWLINNVLSVLQQWLIMHRVERSKA